MDVAKMIAELRAEREHLDEAILVLERIAVGGAKRRGRPPKWVTELRSAQESEGDEGGEPEAEPPAKRGRRKRRPLTAEAKKRMAEAQRKRWAETKRSESGTESSG